MYSNALTTKMLEGVGLERVHYFARQLLTAADMMTEQQFFRQKLRRHNRFLHGWGVVCGCEVQEPDPETPETDHPWQVRVCPGYIIDPQGNEIYIGPDVYFDLAGDWRQTYDPCEHPQPCPPMGTISSSAQQNIVYLAVRYTECHVHPVRVHPVGCACDEAACEYSRVRDDFELARLPDLPKSHENAKKADEQWCKQLQQWLGTPRTSPPPVPPCPECPDDPWVVLAEITLPEKRDTVLNRGSIKYKGRRVLYSVTAMCLQYLSQ